MQVRSVGDNVGLSVEQRCVDASVIVYGGKITRRKDKHLDKTQTKATTKTIKQTHGRRHRQRQKERQLDENMDKHMDKHMDKEMENDKNEFEVKEMERNVLWAETERVLAAKTVEGEFVKVKSRIERKRKSEIF